MSHSRIVDENALVDGRMESVRAKDGFRNEDLDVPGRVIQPPPPGMESVGPALFDLVARSNRSIEVQSELLKQAIPLLNRRTVIEYGSGETDAGGNALIVIYRVPQGMQLVTTRVNVEDFTHTPFAPMTGGWIALIRGDKFTPGCMLDFVPNPASATGAMLPAVMSDGNSEASVVRGGEIISLSVNAGPVTSEIWVRLQGILEPL